MRRSLVLSMLICGLLGEARASATELILIHARVYPSPGVPALENATVVVSGDRIASLTQTMPGQVPPLPRSATVIDCSGLSVTAGLWNSHVHILPVNVLHAEQKSGAQLTSALENMFTRWGFTTVFDLASVLSNTNVIRTRMAAGEIVGPRILTTGEPFFPRHGIPSYVRGYLQQNRIELPDDRTAAAAVSRVRRQIRDGADAIKIFAGSIEENTILLMPARRAEAIVQEAHRLKRPVLAHPSNQAGIDIALDSGVDVLAHVTFDEQPWAPERVRRMRTAHMALIPTLTLPEVEARKGGASREGEQKIVDRAVSRLRAYVEAGGEILFGTDAGYIYQFDTSEEYLLMRRAGMSFAQILASLTTNPAGRFGLADHSGRVAVGMDADLALFEGDPRTDITALSHLRCTIRAGKIIYQGHS